MNALGPWTKHAVNGPGDEEDGLEFEGKVLAEDTCGETAYTVYLVRDHGWILITEQAPGAAPGQVGRLTFAGDRPEADRTYGEDPKMQQLLDRIGFTMQYEGGYWGTPG